MAIVHGDIEKNHNHNHQQKIPFSLAFYGADPSFCARPLQSSRNNCTHIPLLPFIRNDFTLDYTQSGLVVSAFSLAYGVGQLPTGWFADRVGARFVIAIGISGVALAGLFVDLSKTFIMIIVFLVLMGLAGGVYHPAAALLISMSVKPKNLGRALGFHS